MLFRSPATAHLSKKCVCTGSAGGGGGVCVKRSVMLLVRAKQTRFDLCPQGESGLDGPPGPPGAVVSYSSRSTVQLSLKEGQALPGVTLFEFVCLVCRCVCRCVCVWCVHTPHLKSVVC